MGDLDGTQATEAVRVTGSDSGGKETHMVEATANNEFAVCDRLNHGGISDEIVINDSTAIEIKIGALPKTERKCVQIQCLTGRFKWGWTSDKTVFLSFRYQPWFFEVGPDTSIWVKSVSGNQTLAIGETS